MRELAPEGFDTRFPGSRKKKAPRKPLSALGPFHEVSADGHEKLNAQALGMGFLSLPIYVYRDKWSGFILKLVVLPDARKAGALGHVFLDLMTEIGGIPIQMTTDQGSEVGWQFVFQDTSRRLYAPDIDPDVYPTFVTMPSTKNTVSESLWRFLSDISGKNLKDAVLEGRNRYFNPQHNWHYDLFYWVFIPLIQRELDGFRNDWNRHRVRPQGEKDMPSGHVPEYTMMNPASFQGEEDLLIRIPQETIDDYRAYLTEKVGSREEWLSWYGEEFAVVAELAYDEIERPELMLATAWDVFQQMAPVVARYV